MGTYSMLLNCFYHCGSDGKEPACNEGVLDSIPGLGRSSGEMATPSSILAWEIPWTEEPGRLQSMGSQRVRHKQLSNKHTHKRIQTRLIQEIFKARRSSIHIGCHVNAFGSILYFIHWKYQNQKQTTEKPLEL